MIVRVSDAVYFATAQDDAEAQANLEVVEHADQPFVLVEDVREERQRAIFPQSRLCRGVVLLVGDLTCEMRAALQAAAPEKVWFARDFDAILGSALLFSD